MNKLLRILPTLLYGIAFSVVLSGQNATVPGDSIVPIQNLAEQLGNAELFLRNDFKPALDRGFILDEVRNSIDTLRHTSDSLRRISNYVLEQQVATRISASLASRWRRFLSLSREDERKLNNYSRQLTDLRDQLLLREKIWKTTSLSLSSDIPEQVRLRIDTLQLNLKQSAKDLDRRMNEILALQNEVVNQKLLSQTQAAQLEDLEKPALQNLLSVRKPVLFDLPLFENSPAADSYRKVALDYFRKELREFFRNNQERMVLHFMLFFGLGLLLFLGRSLLKKENKAPGRNPEFNLATEIVLAQPLTTAFLLTLLMTPLIYPNRPSVFSELIVMALVVPFLVIVPRFVHQGIRWSIYVVGALFFGHLMLKTIMVSPVFFRWFMLFESLALAFVVFSVGLRDRQWFREAQTSTSFGGIMRLVSPLLLVVSTISALGNISGYDNLADGFNLNLERIFLTGIIVFSAILLIDGLLRFGIGLRSTDLSADQYADRQKFVSGIGRLLRVLGVIVWVAYALGFMRLYKPLEDAFGLVWGLGFSLGQIQVSIGGVIGFALILLAAWLLGRIIQFFLAEDMLAWLQLEKGAPQALGTLARMGVVFLGVLFALAYAGFSLQSLGLILGALAFGLGFGLQSWAANLFAGLILIFKRPIKTGETISQDDLVGEVIEIGLRSTKVLRKDGHMVLVPNADLMNRRVVAQYGADGTRMQELIVRTSSKADPVKVLSLLKNCAIRQEGVQIDPEAKVIFEGKMQDQLQFKVIYWSQKRHEQVMADFTTLINLDLSKENFL